MTRAGVIAAAILALVCSNSTPAAAQIGDYKTLTAAAVEEHQLGHFEEARALFAKAHAIDPNARTLWGMGIAAFEARQYVDALQLLRAASTDARKPLTQAQRKQADSLIERSQSFVVRVPLRVEPGHAKVSVDGREIELDEQRTILLDAGSHQIVAFADGYEESVRSMRWSPGTAPLLELRLEKQRVELASLPPATQASAPAPPASAPVTIASRRDTGGPLRVVKWVSLSGAIASLGITGAGFAMRQSAAAEWNDDRRCPVPKSENCSETRESINTWEKLTLAGGVASGVFGVLTVVLFVLDGRRARAGAEARTRCGPAFGGAVCQTTF
jgi:hypothetical protein